jgi:tetraacyldisaccharide 4'-kinase
VNSWIQGEWQKLGGVALLGLPFALLFRAAVAVRRALYRVKVLPSWRAPVPVIVVGNISAGGTGKTPLVLAIVDFLQREGWNPGVVARGYGRVPPGDSDPRGVVRVYPDVATPEHFGDEPVLIARRARVPVYISPDRPAATRELLSAHREVDVVVSDDGLQHYALARDVEIAVVDAERGFGNRLPLPAGPLREPVSRLRSVDAIVMNGGLRDDVPGERRFPMRLAGERFASLAGNQELGPAEFALAARGRNVVALAGIGNPQRFFDHLASLGVAARGVPLPDHYLYQARDLKLPNAELVVMTEKDAVKCAAFADTRMWFLRVEAVLPREFEELLLERLASTRRADGPQAA